MAVFKTRVDVR